MQTNPQLATVNVGFTLKFSFSEKATKIWRNLPQGFDIT